MLTLEVATHDGLYRYYPLLLGRMVVLGVPTIATGNIGEAVVR